MSENNKLVVLDQTPTAIVGFEGYTIRPAQMKLAQRTSNDPEAKSGCLFDTVSKQNFESVQVVMLAFKTGRVLFPPGGDLGAEPLCRSDNGIVPSPNAQTPQATECALCDFGDKMWKTFKKTGKKPDCSERQNILFVMRDSGLPYWLGINGMSIKNFNMLKDAIYRDILSVKHKEKRSIFDYTFEIKPIFVQGKKGSYYVITFQNVKRIDNPGEFGPAFEQFVKTQREVERDVEVDSVIEAEYVDSPSAQVEV